MPDDDGFDEDRCTEEHHLTDHRLLEMTLSALDDLTAAVTNLQAEQAAVTTAVDDLLAEVANLTAEVAAAGGNQAAIEAAATAVNASAAALKTAASSDPGSQTPPPPAVPVVSSIAPTSGSVNGGDAVTVTGTGLTGATAVNFGTAAATGVTVVSDTEITCTSPANAAGGVDVTVVGPGGTSVTSAADVFTTA